MGRCKMIAQVDNLCSLRLPGNSLEEAFTNFSNELQKFVKEMETEENITIASEADLNLIDQMGGNDAPGSGIIRL